MERKDLIATHVFCAQNNVELSFINSLHEYGLIEITTIEEIQFIPADKLQQLEKLIRLHYDLEINLEGIEAITYLLQKIENMQNEIRLLRDRLHLYENEVNNLPIILNLD